MKQFYIEWIAAISVMTFAYLQGFAYEVLPIQYCLIASCLVLTILMMFQKNNTSFGFVLVQVVSRCATTAIFTSPLLNFYVKKVERGKGVAIEVSGFIFGQLIAHIILASMIKKTVLSIGQVEQNKGLEIKHIYVYNAQAIITALTGILSIPAIIWTLKRKVSRTYG